MQDMFSDCISLRSINFGSRFKFVATDVGFPTPEGATLTGKWVPGLNPRSTIGVETAGALMGQKVGPGLGLWVAQMPADAPVQEWESYLPQDEATSDNPVGSMPETESANAELASEIPPSATSGTPATPVAAARLGDADRHPDLLETGDGLYGPVITLLAVTIVVSAFLSILFATKYRHASDNEQKSQQDEGC